MCEFYLRKPFEGKFFFLSIMTQGIFDTFHYAQKIIIDTLSLLYTSFDTFFLLIYSAQRQIIFLYLHDLDIACR